MGDEVLDEGAGFFQRRVRLLEVDDGDALTVVENVGLGARIPTLGLVTEVDAGIEEVFGSDVHVIYVGTRHRSARLGRLAIVTAVDGYGFKEREGLKRETGPTLGKTDSAIFSSPDAGHSPPRGALGPTSCARKSAATG